MFKTSCCSSVGVVIGHSVVYLTDSKTIRQRDWITKSSPGSTQRVAGLSPWMCQTDYFQHVLVSWQYPSLINLPSKTAQMFGGHFPHLPQLCSHTNVCTMSCLLFSPFSWVWTSAAGLVLSLLSASFCPLMKWTKRDYGKSSAAFFRKGLDAYQCFCTQGAPEEWWSGIQTQTTITYRGRNASGLGWI